jgi:TetR/AcrR family acrAB operon transcriptional repressor/TetR/AcrR family transcriptional repressor of mexAB-oprM operon
MSTAEPAERRDKQTPSKKQLMSAAIDCFARLGYQGTTIDRIARAAGVTKGAIYYHFRDKEQLLFEAVRDRVQGFEGHVLEEVAPAGDAIANLRRVIDACFFHATVSNHRRFIITLMVEALDTNPRLSVEFRSILRRMRAFLAGIVRRGQQQGILRPDVAPEAAAAIIAAGIVGAEVQHYQDPEQIDLRAVLDTLVVQLEAWLVSPSDDSRAAVTGGVTHG